LLLKGQGGDKKKKLGYHPKEAMTHFISYDFIDECLIAQRAIEMDIGQQS
jgi:hypothetical protein